MKTAGQRNKGKEGKEVKRDYELKEGETIVVDDRRKRKRKRGDNIDS